MRFVARRTRLAAVISSSGKPVSAKQNLSLPRSRGRFVFCLLPVFFLQFLSSPLRADSLEDAAHELAIKVCLAGHKQPVKIAWKETPDSSEFWSDSRKALFLEQLSACGMETKPNSDAAVLRVAAGVTPSQLLLLADFGGSTGGPAVQMIAVPRNSRVNPYSAASTPRLNRELQWQQQEPIQSALEWQEPSSRERFLFLVSDGQLIRLQFENSNWRLIDSSALPATHRHSRSGDGFLMFYYPGKSPRLFLDRTSCSFSSSGLISFTCDPVNLVGRDPQISTACEGQFRYLATGKGDYSQPDRITLGSLVQNPALPAPQQSPVDSVEVPGPVLSLSLAEGLKAAFAVVRNLSTGNYEVYRITTVCGN